MNMKMTLGAVMALGLPLNQAWADIEEFKHEALLEVSQSQQREALVLEQTASTREEAYQLGKDIMDVHGNRVRLEQYLLWGTPGGLAANQYKHLVLNTRPDLGNQVTQGYNLYTFNQDLPSDPAAVAKSFGVGVGAPPQYYLTTHELKATGADSDVLLVKSDGGMLVQQTVNNVPVYYNLFATNRTTVNGKDKMLFERVGINSIFEGTYRLSFPGINGALGAAWYDTSGDKIPQAAELNVLYLPASVTNVTYTGTLHDLKKITFRDGTWLARERFIIDDQGKLQTPSSLVSNVEQTGLSNLYRETIVTASEFKSNIDIVWQPAFVWGTETPAANGPVD
ncbi:MAG: hypothetical protein HY549_01305 [Elusimicrobia bacterium]|nr:hypothetical protein [Elusimicrobiota bacterium]